MEAEVASAPDYYSLSCPLPLRGIFFFNYYYIFPGRFSLCRLHVQCHFGHSRFLLSRLSKFVVVLNLLFFTMLSPILLLLSQLAVVCSFYRSFTFVLFAFHNLFDIIVQILAFIVF